MTQNNTIDEHLWDENQLKEVIKQVDSIKIPIETFGNLNISDGDVLPKKSQKEFKIDFLENL